jgi:hypothetical protein
MITEMQKDPTNSGNNKSAVEVTALLLPSTYQDHGIVTLGSR